MITESFTCPRCGLTSHNPNDAREGYCGYCHAWTRDTDVAAENGTWVGDIWVPPVDLPFEGDLGGML